MVVSPAKNAGRTMLWLGLGLQTGALLGRWWESYHLALGHSPTAALAGQTGAHHPPGAAVQLLRVPDLFLLVSAGPGPVGLSALPQGLPGGPGGAALDPLPGLCLFRGGQPDQTLDAGPEEQLAAHPRGDRLPGLRRLRPGLRDRHPLPFPGTAAPAIAARPCPCWTASSTGPPSWGFSC